MIWIMFTFDAHDQDKRGIIGRTDNGRFLTVIYTRRDDGFYVITARKSTENEKKYINGGINNAQRN